MVCKYSSVYICTYICFPLHYKYLFSAFFTSKKKSLINTYIHTYSYNPTSTRCVNTYILMYMNICIYGCWNIYVCKYLYCSYALKFAPFVLPSHQLCNSNRCGAAICQRWRRCGRLCRQFYCLALACVTLKVVGAPNDWAAHAWLLLIKFCCFDGVPDEVLGLFNIGTNKYSIYVCMYIAYAFIYINKNITIYMHIHGHHTAGPCHNGQQS